MTFGMVWQMCGEKEISSIGSTVRWLISTA
jgi:hypothetical protein